jgi:hypothetical protein
MGRICKVNRYLGVCRRQFRHHIGKGYANRPAAGRQIKNAAEAAFFYSTWQLLFFHLPVELRYVSNLGLAW